MIPEIQNKVYNLDEMTIEDITDLGAQLNEKKSKCEKLLEECKNVVKSRYADKEFSSEVSGTVGDLSIKEADDFHPLDPQASFEAMKTAGFADRFPDICSVNLNDSGKRSKVKTLGITHFLPQVIVDKLRKKKAKKMVTVYFTMKKESVSE